jgi:hypothetical protein
MKDIDNYVDHPVSAVRRAARKARDAADALDAAVREAEGEMHAKRVEVARLRRELAAAEKALANVPARLRRASNVERVEQPCPNGCGRTFDWPAALGRHVQDFCTLRAVAS